MTSRRTLGSLAALLAAVSSAQAYYHFVHYTPAASGYRQIPEKFDLTGLVNNTVTYVISQNGPDKLADGDSWTGLVSQIHQAARAWSSVPTSQLRLAFGGFVKPGAPASAPEVEIVFDDVPPGLVALGGPTSRGDLAGPDNARFVPILKSTVILRKDLSLRPSWSEALSLTLTHELGHALGLQHALASGVMATEITRAVTKAAPLADDDRAGISALYPTPEFAARFGTITGRVTVGADGMNLASVVALTADGTAIAALTNPDGTYRMEGVPPGNYFLYAHPLPPALAGEAYPDNVTPPSEIGGTALPSSGLFDSQFFPGVQQADDASIVVVKAGETAERIDFRVTRRTTVPVYAVQTFSFPGVVALKPSHLSPAYSRNLMVATGPGLVAGGALAPGLVASVMGPTAAVGSVRPYTPDPRFLQIDMQLHPIPGEGARHMIFRRDGVTHVLPAALRLVAANPPVISEWAAVTDDAGVPFIELRGSGFTADSRVMFDGVGARIASATATALRVTPPPAATGHKAALVVLNADGQSSLFLGGTLQTFAYGDAADAGISVSPAALTPGVETVVEIRGSGTAFNASTIVSFGTADVIVRRQWVVSPGRIIANVIALGGATPGKVTLAVVTGLRELTLTDGVQISEPPARVVSVASAIVDDATGRGAISPGFTARVRLRGAAANLTPASFTVRVNGVAAPAISFADSVLVFRIPAALAPGPATTEITAAAEALPPVMLAVDLPPPVVASASLGTTARPATGGDVVTFRVTGLVEGTEAVSAQRLQVTVGGAPAKIVQVVTAPAAPAGHDIVIELDAKQAAGTLPVVVALDGRPSAPFNLVIR